MKLLLTFSKVASQLIFFLVIALSFHQAVSSEEGSITTCRNRQQISGQTLEQIGQEKYRQYVLKAKSNIAVLRAETSLQFPLGVNCPFKLEHQSERTGYNVQAEQLVVIGFLDQSNQLKPITSADLNEMFDRNLRFLGVSRDTRSNQTSSSSNPTGSNPDTPRSNGRQRLNVPVINLVALNTRSKQVYLIPDVDFMSVYRDALNAALNNELSTSSFDLSQLNLDSLNQQAQEI